METNRHFQYTWKIIKIATMLLILLSPRLIMAQTPYKLIPGKDNIIKVLGT